jgi:hypothetical protein
VVQADRELKGKGRQRALQHRVKGRVQIQPPLDPAPAPRRSLKCLLKLVRSAVAAQPTAQISPMPDAWLEGLEQIRKSGEPQIDLPPNSICPGKQRCAQQIVVAAEEYMQCTA